MIRKILENIQELELEPSRGFKPKAKTVKHAGAYPTQLDHEWTWIDFDGIPGYDKEQDPPLMPGPLLDKVLEEMSFAEDADTFAQYVDLMNQIAVQAMRVASVAKDDDKNMTGGAHTEGTEPLWKYRPSDDHFNDVKADGGVLGQVTSILQSQATTANDMHAKHIIELANAVAQEAISRAGVAKSNNPYDETDVPEVVYQLTESVVELELKPASGFKKSSPAPMVADLDHVLNVGPAQDNATWSYDYFSYQGQAWSETGSQEGKPLPDDTWWAHLHAAGDGPNYYELPTVQVWAKGDGSGGAPDPDSDIIMLKVVQSADAEGSGGWSDDWTPASGKDWRDWLLGQVSPEYDGPKTKQPEKPAPTTGQTFGEAMKVAAEHGWELTSGGWEYDVGEVGNEKRWGLQLTNPSPTAIPTQSGPVKFDSLYLYTTKGEGDGDHEPTRPEDEISGLPVVGAEFWSVLADDPPTYAGDDAVGWLRYVFTEAGKQ